MSLAGRDLITMSDLSTEEIRALLDTAGQMAEAIGFGDAGKRHASERLDRIMATCFFEPSTRTRLSFESAMLRLGGSVLGFSEPGGSSVAKGETLADTARTVSGYADILVIRHPKMGAAKVAADAAEIPVINAGDGAHAHPTQTLTDLFCLKRRFDRLDGLTVGLFGDLKYGRTVHSLGATLARLGSQVVCIAPEQLAMPKRYLDEIEEISGERPQCVTSVDGVLGELDVLYATRVQVERFPEEEREGARAIAADFVVDAALMERAPENMIVMHPLPRVEEINPEIDDDSRAAYFEQAHGGVPVRMALVAHLLGLLEDERNAFRGFERRGDERPEAVASPGRARQEAEEGPDSASAERKCRNDRCITWEERFLAGFFQTMPCGEVCCAYCEEPLEEED
ncbi:MAG: aspartate carbamoyltransferase [candidate division WS1 bacterium]|nr:aspartate carbamoyltransferase [candidate division WS1 bacterium]